MQNLTTSKINPFIGSRDYEESKASYQAIGWTMIFDSPDIAEMQLGESCFYLQRYYERKWCENSMLHITVEDAHAWYDKVNTVLQERRYGAARVEPPREQSYGALVTFVWDPAGVLLHFAQPRQDGAS
ncbi:MAG: hypothetical protein O2971_09630 [Proteobacteria bacterium]|nr:hypothetical protein [Pseudomonadota bacterium]